MCYLWHPNGASDPFDPPCVSDWVYILERSMTQLFIRLSDPALIVFLMTIGLLLLHVCVILFSIYRTKVAETDGARLRQELFGLMRRIEGLSTGRRALITYQFDNMLESLVKQLPTRIANEAGQRIVDTESQILKALSEIEPALAEDRVLQSRLEQVLHSMENLEAVVVSVTCESVRQAIVDVRQTLLSQDGIEAGYR